MTKVEAHARISSCGSGGCAAVQSVRTPAPTLDCDATLVARCPEHKVHPTDVWPMQAASTYQGLCASKPAATPPPPQTNRYKEEAGARFRRPSVCRTS